MKGNDSERMSTRSSAGVDKSPRGCSIEFVIEREQEGGGGFRRRELVFENGSLGLAAHGSFWDFEEGKEERDEEVFISVFAANIFYF